MSKTYTNGNSNGMTDSMPLTVPEIAQAKDPDILEKRALAATLARVQAKVKLADMAYDQIQDKELADKARLKSMTRLVYDLLKEEKKK